MALVPVALVKKVLIVKHGRGHIVGLVRGQAVVVKPSGGGKIAVHGRVHDVGGDLRAGGGDAC